MSNINMDKVEAIAKTVAQNVTSEELREVILLLIRQYFNYQ